MSIVKKEVSINSEEHPVASPEKQFSKICILILVIATITLYSFCINELSKTVIGIVEALVQETIPDSIFSGDRTPKFQDSK